MNDLEMCKAMAKLEGLDVHPDGNHPQTNVACMVRASTKYIRWNQYNPITDLALNCVLRDTYGVSIDYTSWSDDYICEIFIAKQIHDHSACTKPCCNESEFDWSLVNDSDVYPKSKEDIPRAVIECILKSRGLYNE